MINALAMLLAFTSTLLLGWTFMVLFRKLTTGVKSPFIPDGTTLSEDKKTIGTAFACLFGSALSLFSVVFLTEKQHIPVAISSMIFITAMCFLGYLDDKKLLLSRENVGIRTQNRLALTLIFSLLFAIIFMATGQDTVVSIPFSREKIRLSGLFGIFTAAVTLVCNEGERTTGNKNHSEILRGILKLTALIFVTALDKNFHLMLLPSVYVGALAGGLFWTDFKKVLKTGYCDKALVTAMVLTACFATENEGMMIFLFAPEIFCLTAYPADKLFHKLSGKRIFNRLPIDEHLKSLKISEKKIKILYVTVTALFALTAIGVKMILIKTE